MQPFTSAITSGFKNWKNFNGRATRSEYWYFVLSSYILGFLVGLVVGGSGLIYLIYIVPLVAVGIRRMHDTSHSGWWIIVPIANLVFACTKSDPLINKYGPPRPPVSKT